MKPVWITPSDAAAPAPQAVQVFEIAPVHFGPGGGERRGGRIRSGEAEHLVARADEFLNDGGADEACRSGDENTHQVFSLICLQDRNLNPLVHRVGD